MGSVQIEATTQLAKLDRESDPYMHRNVLDLFSLRGRVTVITGGARGIGLALAFAVAEVGSHVAILDILTEPHEHYHRLKNDYSVKVQLYKTDITRHAAVNASFDEVVRDFGRVDCLITAAGICPDQPFLTRSPESVTRTMNVNVLGTYFATQCAVQRMVKQTPVRGGTSRGSVLMIGSICAYQASKMQCLSDYCASKGAVTALARELAVELAESGIRVNSISPGFV